MPKELALQRMGGGESYTPSFTIGLSLSIFFIALSMTTSSLVFTTFINYLHSSTLWTGLLKTFHFGIEQNCRLKKKMSFVEGREGYLQATLYLHMKVHSSQQRWALDFFSLIENHKFDKLFIWIDINKYIYFSNQLFNNQYSDSSMSTKKQWFDYGNYDKSIKKRNHQLCN